MPGTSADAGLQPDAGQSRARRQPRRWLPRRTGARIAAAAVVALLVAILGWAGADAVLARDKLTSARDQLLALSGAAHLTKAAALGQLREAITEASDAESLLGQPGAAALAHVPVLGRTWVAERTIARVSRTVLQQFDRLVTDASAVGTGGHVDLNALAGLGTAIQAARHTLDPELRALAALRSGLTPGPVGSGIHQAQAKLLPLGDDLAKAAAGVAALQDIFGASGPRTVMIALQNNSELRATGGLIGSFAFAHSHDGALHVGPFRDVDRFVQSAGFARTVAAPADFASAYHQFLADTTLWKNVNFSPSVPDSAAVLANVAARSTGTRADTVLMLDVPAVAALLDGSGATVRLPDGTVASGTTLVRDLLVQSYGSTANTPSAQRQRHLGIEHAADGALRTALNTPPSLSLLIALGKQIAGRHITIWSSHPAVEEDLVTAGAAGTVGTPTAAVAYAAASNLGDSPGNGNKLDYYAHRSVTVRVAASHTRADVQETITVRNTAPPDLPGYVQGLHHPGRLQELWNVVIPGAAQEVGLQVNGQLVRADSYPIDGQREIVVPVTTPRGATSTITWSYALPVVNDRFRIEVLPQPLAQPATLSLDVYGTGGADVSQPFAGTEPFASAVTLDERVS